MKTENLSLYRQWLVLAFEHMLGYTGVGKMRGLLPLSFYWERKRWEVGSAPDAGYPYKHEYKEKKGG